MIQYVVIFLSLCFFTACQPREDEKPPKTQLEIRQFQTRNFETQDLRLVMKSLLDVLQDDGYVVKNVALDLGFLTATREEDVEDRRDRLFSQLAHGGQARWQKSDLVEATVNVTEFGNAMRVRANFQHKVYDNTGVVMAIDQIADEEFYQEFFAKVHKGIFIQEQLL